MKVNIVDSSLAVAVLSVLAGAGLEAEVIEGLLSAPEPKPAPLFTHADAERIANAEAKRQRKAAKRIAKQGGNHG